jgi:hypothetical protein
MRGLSLKTEFRLIKPLDFPLYIKRITKKKMRFNKVNMGIGCT